MVLGNKLLTNKCEPSYFKTVYDEAGVSSYPNVMNYVEQALDDPLLLSHVSLLVR